MFGAAVRPVNKLVTSPSLVDGVKNDRRHFPSFWFDTKSEQMMKPFPRYERDISLKSTGPSGLDLLAACDHSTSSHPLSFQHLASSIRGFITRKNLMLQWKPSDGHRLIKITTCVEKLVMVRFLFVVRLFLRYRN